MKTFAIHPSENTFGFISSRKAISHYNKTHKFNVRGKNIYFTILALGICSNAFLIVRAVSPFHAGTLLNLENRF